MNFTRASWSKTYLKQSNNFSFLSILFFLWLLISFSSCKKTEDFYLEGNAPEAPFGLELDTLNLSLQTEQQSKTRTDKLSNDLLGTYMDPVFGRSTANVYAQLSLSQYNPGFTATSKFDSFLLYISIVKNASTGNLQDVQNWKVYKLEESLQGGKDYFSNDKFAISATEIGSYKGAVNPQDTVIRIHLNETFGRSFFTENKGSFSDNASFAAFMKGIAILPDTTGLAKGKGAIISTDLTHKDSKMVLYYDTAKSLSMTFGTNVRVNTYSHDYTNTEAGDALSPNHFSGKVYMQSMAGLRINVSIPDLKNLAQQGKLALHKAELVFPKADSAADPQNKFQPEIIYILPRDENGENTAANFVDPGYSYFDGTFSTADNSYHLVITRYLQDLVSGYNADAGFKHYGFNLIVPTNDPVTARRVILSAKKQGQAAPKLILTYTKLAK